jgi:hypothetical protein
MKRDMDLVRELLLKIEGRVQGPGEWLTLDPVRDDDLGIDGFSVADICYHLRLLVDASMLDTPKSLTSSEVFEIVCKGLSWRGHDFLDSVRDPEIWHATKEGVKKAGGFSVELLSKLAKGFVAKKIEEHTGVKIDL